ncbi:uncharacterized protein MCAP_0864-like [Leptopilina heterotoma]|uniref:uncharacterized protein MCAP_0864-like n=1 Tax=Leptopilina heterotoma TaxID=63436 RepID=UPI001CA89C42|nr:uncharacterized protein MCAP_0864-like [Leptopilina heterotoma]
MNEKKDNFAWAQKLGFSGRTDSVLLNKGIIGLLWDDASKLLHHPKDVMETRKNILLYKLKNNLQDPCIDYIKNGDQLKAERSNLKDRIKVAEEKNKEQESKTIKKENELRLLKCKKESPTMKKELLKMKVEQVQEILKDSSTMLNISKHLMPASNKDVSLKEIRECLNLISNIRSGVNKKEIINKVRQILDGKHVPTLWSLLTENQSQDMETLISLGKKEVSEFKTTIGEDIDIGLAKICGEHIKTVSMQLLEIANTSENERILMEWIERIELAEPGITEWLENTLEVRMHEVEQNTLLKEINDISNSLDEQENLETELSEISTKLENLSSEKKKLIDEVQKSLNYLKGIRYLITETREKQLVHLQAIANLRSDTQEPDRKAEPNLSLELETFYKELDIEALRQITVKKQFSEQRHLNISFNNSLLHLSDKFSGKLTNSLSILKIPFYFLLESYKAMYTNALLKRNDNAESFDLLDEYPQWDVSRLDNVLKSNMELLQHVNLICKKSREHVNEFDHLFDIWNQESFESAFKVLEELTVDGVTLKDWQQRYSIVMYMLKKSSKVSLSFQPYSFEEQ